MSDFDYLLGRRPPPTPASLRSSVVVRSDESGVWAAALGADRRVALGPCRGARRTRTTTSPSGGGVHDHQLVVEQLPVGTVVLLYLDGQQRPWITAWEDSDA